MRMRKAMDKPLTNQHVAVTGGGTGLGLAICKAMANAGATVTMVGRRQDVLEVAAEWLGGDIHCVVGDISKIGTVPDLAGKLAAIAPVDVLVNNAGTHHKASALETSDDDFDRVISTNLKGTFALTREVAREMTRRGSGSILMISSMAALFGIPGVSSYSASKAALIGLMRELAVEFGPSGVRVNAIAPGFIETDMNRGIFQKDPRRLEKILDRTPLGRLGSAEDVAEAALYLCSPGARFVTGVCFPVDGGMSIGF